MPDILDRFDNMKKLLLAFILFFITVATFAQVPDISYPGPQEYIVGKTITNLSPLNNGGAVPAKLFGQVTTLAGSVAGAIDATGTGARFKAPYGLTKDSQGNIYVADSDNDVIRKITPAGVVSTFVPKIAGLNEPTGLAIDINDNIYIADAGNNQIKKVTPAGVVSVYAGTGAYGFAIGPALLSSFKYPAGVAIDAAGTVYVADYGNHQIRKVSTDGIVSELAGTGVPGLLNGPPTAARFRNPFGVAVDATGNVYVAEVNNHAIRKISPGGEVTTVAGATTSGFVNANGIAARFKNPYGVAVDPNGNLFITDAGNSLLRKITPAGDVTTVAGIFDIFNSIDGIGSAATFGFPVGIVPDKDGTVYVADNGTHRIRKVITNGYSITPALPAGLIFDNATGVISGKPTVVSPAQIYTISACNNAGNGFATITIATRLISTDATLQALVPGAGSLSPSFNPALKKYVVNVPDNQTDIVFTPTSIDKNSTILINGSQINNGTTSGKINLNTGSNVVDIKVTAEDGLTVINYQVVVTRSAAAVAPPVITYGAPKVFTVGTTITPVIPANSGGSVPENQFGEVTTLANGFNHPTAVVTDAVGNVVLSDFDNKKIMKITPAGVVSTLAGAQSGFNAAWGVGTDALGNVYVADSQNNYIRKITPAGVVSIFAGSGGFNAANGPASDAGFAYPTGVAASREGDLYVTDAGNNLIRKISLNGEVSTVAGTGAVGAKNGSSTTATFNNPFGVATDAVGNVYIADRYNHAIRVIDKTGSVKTFAGSGGVGSLNLNGTAATFSTPHGVAVDQLGNVYVADSYNSMIRKITPTGDVTLLAGNGNYSYSNGVGENATFSLPFGIACDNSGHLYVADYLNNAVRKIDITGYEINPVLPAGLVFDGKTGTISGKPTAKSNAQSYAITAYNLGGSSKTFVNLSVGAITDNANLTALVPGTSALSPAFNSAKIDYSMSVGNAVSAITFRPTVAEIGATVAINGINVTSGSVSAPIPLAAGPNEIKVVVTATNGTTTKTYTVIVTRAGAADANLASFTMSGGTLSPAFSNNVLSYSSTVPNSVTSITFTPTASQPNAVIKVNGVTIASGTASAAFNLNVGPNEINTVVTAQDGSTIKIYKTTVTRSPSSNANLANISLSAGVLSPSFASGTTAYTTSISSIVSQIAITPIVSDATATVKVNGVLVASGAASNNIPLNDGETVITLLATAEDALTTRPYTITVKRASASNADLTNLSLSNGTLSPGFASAEENYSASVDNSVTSINLTPVLSDINATAIINGTTVANGLASGNVPLNVGENVIKTVVTAVNGVSKKTYTVTITRNASANADLALLTLSAGVLDAPFTAGNLTYTATADNSVASIQFTPILSDADATVIVNGTAVVNGLPSAPIALNVGANVVTTEVTAQNGVTKKTYVVTITRALSPDARLSDLQLSAGTLDPVFSGSTLNYNTKVPNEVSAIAFTPFANDINATIKVNGNAVLSGAASDNIALTVGVNEISTLVTAQDGSSKIYTVKITRAPSANANLSALSASAGVLSPSFTAKNLAYTLTVPNLNSSITVLPVKSDAAATIKVKGEVVASGSASQSVPLNVGSDNFIDVLVTAADGTLKNYKLTVTRLPSANADLTNLTLNAATLNPVFTTGQLTYTAAVGHDISTVTLTPLVSDATATVKVNGIEVASGAASGNIGLNTGSNTLSTIVTAADGTTQIYTVTVIRAFSADATLADLTSSIPGLITGFASSSKSYAVTVSNPVSSITIIPTVNNAGATVTVNGTTVVSGAASGLIALNVGTNFISVSVTAQDGISKNTYTINVTRAQSSNADLSALTLSEGDLDSEFLASITSYNAQVRNGLATISLTPVHSDVSSTIKINGNPVLSGTASAALPLAVGPNVFTVEVKAQDGTLKNYIVTVNRAPSTDAGLASLSLSPGMLNQVFSPGLASYTAEVGNATTHVNVTAIVTEPNAVIQTNGVTVPNGTASGNINLTVGENIITTTVTAQDGIAKKIYTIAVTRLASSDADLAALDVSSGALNPTFAKSITSYTLSVINTVKTITLSPTVNEPNATVKVNGTTVASGSASIPVSLNVGTNTITVVVLAQDGTTSKPYTVTVNRAQSSDAGLADLEISNASLTPAFSLTTLSYSASVANAVTSVTVRPVINEPNATVKVNGITVASGSASGPIRLTVGSNVINTVVTAQDGSTFITYQVTVTRELSSDATLTALKLSTGDLAPAISSGAEFYTASVANSVRSITLSPTVTHPNATVKVNGITVASGLTSAPIALVVGSNIIATIVTAEDGVTTKTYTATIIRVPSSNANLTSLVISSGELNQSFASNITSYSMLVKNNVTELTLTPTMADNTATVSINGQAVASGTVSQTIRLSTGNNTLTTVVTAQDGITKKSYTIIVNRALSSDNDLADLKLSSGTLTPAFESGIDAYSATVGNALSSITLTPVLADANASVKINGTAVASGSASGPVNLKVGNNTIIAIVTAQDGAPNTYTVVVKRSPGTNADLADLGLSKGTLNTPFVTTDLNYTASVDNLVSSIALKPTLVDGNATVKVNSVLVVGGAASGNIPLDVGPNVITATVTAQDGITTKLYTVTITRAKSPDATLAALTTSAGALSPAFTASQLTYSISVENETAGITITPTRGEANAAIAVNDLTVVSGTASQAIPLAVGSDNVVKVVVTAEDGTTKEYVITVTRKVSSNADLANITLSSGTLSPTFAAATIDYKATVENTVLSIRLTPTVSDATATITVNDKPVASGAASESLPLIVGANPIKTVVTAANGTSKIYSVNVRREASANADLGGFTLSAGVLSEAFDPGLLNYTAVISNTNSNVTVTPSVSDPNSTVTVNGTVIASGVASGNIRLLVGENPIVVIVTAQNGDKKTYNIIATREASANAGLANLTLRDGILDPVFSQNTLDYDAIVGNATANITFTPTVTDATAAVTVNGKPVANGTASGLIALNVGDNEIKTVVTAQNGIASKTYTVTVKRARSSNANLSNIVLSSGAMSEVFSPTQLTYSALVLNSVRSILLTPTVADATATVKVNDVFVSSGTESNTIPLVIGTNTITTLVTAEDGTTKKYTITLTREKSGNANLSGLFTSPGMLSPAFSTGENNYTAEVGNDVITATVTPTASEADAIITIKSQTVVSGSSSDPLPLTVGNNDVVIKVKAANGNVKTYTVNIKRAKSNNSDLSSILLSEGTLSPAFTAGTLSYKAKVLSGVDKLKISSISSDADATIRVNGTVVSSGSSSGNITLGVGENPIVITVTAADGTSKIYSVTVTRETPPPSANADLVSLVPSDGSLNPVFSRDNRFYTITVNSNVNKINLTGITSDVNATLTMNGVAVESGSASPDIVLTNGPNQVTIMVTAANGIATKSYNVVVTKASFAAALPTVFTPNGDGVNDTWVLSNIELYPDCTVRIFNRGGQLIFSSVGYGTPWDGTYKGQVLPPDVYYYIIDLKHNQGIRSGSITIIK